MTYEIKDTNTIKSEIILNIIANVDTINDANIGSTLDLFVTSMSQELALQYEDLEIVYNACRISTASDEDLEEIGAIVGVDRNIGTQAIGNVSFIRNTPTTANITIPLGTIIATQPNTNEEQLQYTTTESKILYATIADEEHLFTDGISLYKLNSRFFDEITSFTGTVGGSPYTFINNVDYEIGEDYEGVIIDEDSINLINDCETVGDWTEGNEALVPSANTGVFIEGTQSMNMRKSGTTSSLLSYTATYATTFNLISKSLVYNVYINNSTTLGKVKNINIIVSDDSGYVENYKSVHNEFIVGWNQLILTRTNGNIVTTGNPDYTKLKYLKIEVETNANSNTFVAGDLLLDFIFISNYINYVGDVIRFLGTSFPDAGTDFLVSYKPLSVDIQCQAFDVGTKYNVSKGQVNYKVSSLANINRLFNYLPFSSGVNIETDLDYRARIKTAGDLIDVSTVPSITANVLGLPFIKTCVVNDLPLKNTEDAYIYNDTTKKITLLQKVALDNVNLIISDTSGGSADYINGTDYVLTDENEIDFDQGGSEPTNGNTVYISYDYKKLGYFEVFVSGLLGELNTFELEEIEDLVEEKKAAGVNYEIKQPSYISIDVEVTLTIDADADVDIVEGNVEDNIRDYVNSLPIGGDVLLARLINVIMDVDGVDNVVIDDIAGGTVDYPISDDEKAISGVITIN
jgi:hypothetical protein